MFQRTVHTSVCIGRVNVWNTLHALRLFSIAGAQSVQKNGYNRHQIKASFGLGLLKFNSHHINVPSNAWSTKCRLIECMWHRLGVIYEINLLSLISPRLETCCQIRRKCYSIC
jgi:hypothetical protein